MNDAEKIIKDLKLEPHPEGGHFVECLRTKDMSIIYYLLKKNEKSHWHRLSKNETLHFYKGDPLAVYLSEDKNNYNSIKIGEKNNFHITIKSGTWFAMKSMGEYSLIGCSVAPAFNYDDFELAPKNWKPRKFNDPL
tara:strand:+ start:173 stop:580 length:408 start_codon:yes stop_codon:yes gene_type:complete